MKTVETVLGPISTERIGTALMHEHLCTSSMGIATHYPQMYRKDYLEVITGDLNEMKANGIHTVVEATPVCLGRDVRTLKKVSEASGVHIIATSGWWGSAPPYLGQFSDEQWARCFVDDVTVGCDGTDIKAGILKAAMDMDGPTPWRTQIHRAVGMAAVETGKNIMLHTYCPTETPRHQLRILREMGVDMNKVAVDHIPETTDLDFVKWIYDQGVWLGIDRLPIILLPGSYAVSTETRIKFIKTMLDAGMGDRMLFSHDFMSTSTLFDNQPQEVRELVAAECPGRFLFLQNHVFPKLIELGADPAELQKIYSQNPRKFFES